MFIFLFPETLLNRQYWKYENIMLKRLFAYISIKTLQLFWNLVKPQRRNY